MLAIHTSQAIQAYLAHATQAVQKLVVQVHGPSTSASQAQSRRVLLLLQFNLKLRPTVQLKPDSMCMRTS